MTQTEPTAAPARHECPGGCGREDVPRYLYACVPCMRALPEDLAARMTSQYEHTRFKARAEAKLFWESLRGGA